MTKRLNIKEFIEKAFRDCVPAEKCWRTAQEMFPYNCVNWVHVLRIYRRMERSEQIDKE